MDEPQLLYCYRHPDRQTYITCRRCGRPICGECMIPAAVGFQCPQCVKAGARATRQHQGPYGGELSTNPRQTSLILIIINAAVFLVTTFAQYVLPQVPLLRWLALARQGVCVAADNANTYYPGVSHATCRASLDGAWMPGVADGAWWQLITSMFVHFSFVHIAMNCLTLWFLGPALESYLGRIRFLTTYFVAGVGGSLAVYWLSSPMSLTGGASGALFGVMGALLVVLWQQKADVRQLLLWLGLNLVMTFAPLFGFGGSISWQAHIGGLVVGALLGAIWTFVPNQPSRNRTQWLLVIVAVVLIILGLIGRTLTQL